MAPWLAQYMTKCFCIWTMIHLLFWNARNESSSSSFSLLLFADAKLACTSSEFCQTTLHKDSNCVQGYCDNPYQYGCLQSKLPDRFGGNSRICNSEDPSNAMELGLCRPPKSGIEYSEIRILSQNWESPFFESWILQIVLSEILDVPMTMESGMANRNINFYDPQGRFEYGVAYDMDALELASDIGGDCTSIVQTNMEKNNDNENDDYVSCGHALFELWSGQDDVIARLLEKDAIEPLSFIGVIGEEGWLISKYTAEADPTLLSHFGLAGEENRRKLAERFQRPTTWKDYCKEVHPNGCVMNQDTATTTTTTTTKNETSYLVAVRPPFNDDEGQRYFVDGLYTGHFRMTEENDCDKWPTNCTGHFLDYPCGWTSFFIQQAHHLNIALKSGGDEPGSNGYPYARMVEIWNAANWTKSDIIGWWWRPEALYQQYQGTDFELQNIVFPPTNHRCVDNRANVKARCGDDDELRVGNPLGVCDVPPIPNYKIISTGLHKLINNPEIPDPLRSPAYDIVKEYTVDGFILGEIFEYWLRPNVDRFGFDPRDAVCTWVSEHLEDLERLIPRSYPRQLQEQEESIFDIVALVLGAFAAASTLISVGATYQQRKRRAFVFAQIEFVFLLLFGLLLVSTTAVLTAMKPTDTRCVTTVWLLNVGYSFELVPLVVKIAAINTLMAAAKRMKRIVLQRSLLFGVVAVLTGMVVIYMIFWTLFDPPVRTGDYELTDVETDEGNTVVTVAYFCESKSQYWMISALGVQGLLLLCASVLAFMTRKMRKDINEANTIAFLIYWNFVCVLLRIILFLLADKVDAARLNRSLSMILSADSLATILIYFIPKFLEKDRSTPTGGTFVSVDLRDMWRPGPMPYMMEHSEPSASDFRPSTRVSWADVPTPERSTPFPGPGSGGSLRRNSCDEFDTSEQSNLERDDDVGYDNDSEPESSSHKHEEKDTSDSTSGADV